MLNNSKEGSGFMKSGIRLPRSDIPSPHQNNIYIAGYSMYVCYCTYVMHIWLHAVCMHAARMHAVRVRMHSVNSSVSECKSAHALNR